MEPLATAFLPSLFNERQQRYPLIRLDVLVRRTDDVLTLVERGDVDLGLIFDPTLQPEILVVKELFRQPVQLLVPADHPFALPSTPALSLQQICHEPFVLLRPTSRLRRSIDRMLAQQGIVLNPVVEIESIAGLCELVRQGCGITLIPPALLSAQVQRDDIRLVPVKDVFEQCVFALVYRRFGTIAGPARQFIQLITEAALKE